LASHASPANLLLHLRKLSADAHSDELLRDLSTLPLTDSPFVQHLLVLAFLPLLHRTVRLVTKQQLGLAPEDIAQQALSFFLEFLRSAEMRDRRSHFAFAISREVKRYVLTWARRESLKAAPLADLDAFQAAPEDQSSIERLTELRHFLHRCVTKGVLTDAELRMLVESKLNGGNAHELGEFNGTSSNALRQKLKRLLARLRRIARNRSAENF
jgi:DNA-directed RNA polymerase specialized sigma24 family protein